MINIKDLGCIAGKEIAGKENSRLINVSLIKRKGGCYKIPPGFYYFAKPIQIPAGYAATFYGDGTGQWRYYSKDLIKVLPTKNFPNKRQMFEFGGPDSPNGSFRQQARGSVIENIGFDFNKQKNAEGIGFYQNEQTRIISCQFYKCRVGIRIKSEDKRWNMNHLVQSCQFNSCEYGLIIAGEGAGQTFGGVNLQSLIIQKCGIGIYQRSINVPTNIISATIQNSKNSGLYFDNAAANLMGCYMENFHGAVDFNLTKNSRLYCIGWNRASSWKTDYTSKLLGEVPEK